MSSPRSVVDRETELSQWVTLVERTVAWSEHDTHTYHAFRQNDYVSILAITQDGKVPLVRQFRPALGRDSLELPGGLLEANEAPKECAVRELLEETGHRLQGTELVLLGSWDADSGRLQNSVHAFFAPRVECVGHEEWQPESKVQLVLVSLEELFEAMRRGAFRHAMHVAVVGTAVVQGHLKVW